MSQAVEDKIIEQLKRLPKLKLGNLLLLLSHSGFKDNEISDVFQWSPKFNHELINGVDHISLKNIAEMSKSEILVSELKSQLTKRIDNFMADQLNLLKKTTNAQWSGHLEALSKRFSAQQLVEMVTFQDPSDLLIKIVELQTLNRHFQFQIDEMWDRLGQHAWMKLEEDFDRLQERYKDLEHDLYCSQDRVFELEYQETELKEMIAELRLQTKKLKFELDYLNKPVWLRPDYKNQEEK